MNLERKALLDAINTIKPALASKDLIPELCHLWFDGAYALAYNDADLGMQIPFKTPFTGGIRGTLLLGLLHNSRAREITIEEDTEGFMMLKAAKMKARLAILDIKSMNDIWQFPEPNIKKAFDLTDEFGAMLKAVLVAVGNDTSIPEKMGVTLSLGEDMALYATDSSSIAQGILDLPPGYKKGKEKRIILPTAFCEQLTRLCGNKGSFLELREDCAIAGDAEGLNIFARLIDSAKPLDFDGTVEKHTKAMPKGSKFDIPERLDLALDRAMVMLDGMPGAKVDMIVSKKKLMIEADVQGRGEFRDSVDVPEGLPEVSFKMEPSLIKRALPLTTSMVCMETAVYMTDGKGFRYLAATAG